MADYVRYLSNPSVGDVHVQFARVLQLARELDALTGRGSGTRQVVLRAYDKFNRELDALAQSTAVNATKRIQERLKATAKRPDTGVRPHLRNGIVSRPLKRFGLLGTGEVGVAAIDSLNKVVSATSPGYGPYWRAQEFGTGSAEVKSQKGRVIRGYFFGPGLSSPAVPTKGRSDQPIFVPGRQKGGVTASGTMKGGIGPSGGRGGYGTIGREIQGRHFIRDGADLARAEWLREMRAIERATIRGLDAVLTGAPRRGTRGRGVPTRGRRRR